MRKISKSLQRCGCTSYSIIIVIAFNNNITVCQILSVLWDLEPEDVEDILEEFVNKSLLFVDSNHKPYLYYLHDLQLDFLVEQNRSHLEVSLELKLYKGL